jgi:hypothetical protein
MREDNITKIFNVIKKVGSIKLYKEDIKDASINADSYSYTLKNEPVRQYFFYIYSEFENLIYNQLESNCDVNLLNKFVESAKEVFQNDISSYKYYLNTTSLKLQQFNAEEEKKYRLFSEIHFNQVKTIKRIFKLLDHEIEFFEYKYNQKLSSQTSKFHEKVELVSNVDIINKATFNLSKADSVMLIHMLEVCDLIKFENNAHKISFIEQHFNYTELRNNDDFMKAKSIQGVQVELSNLKSNDKDSRKRFNKNLESLQEKLETIMDFKLES